jgi:putative endonuclease
MRTYYVYMLQCFDGTYYVGVTNNVDRRFYEHTSGHDPGGYTFSRRPLLLVHVSEFSNPSDAIDFEKRLKGWSHRKKRVFAQGDWTNLVQFSKTAHNPDPPCHPEPVEGSPPS